MAISLIAALDENSAIGRKGQLPWHLPDDLRWFKELTLGKFVLMGYNTAVSVGRALPGRTNLVLTRKHEAPFPGQVTVRSLEEGLARAGGTGLMVIGGGEVYKAALPKAQRLFLTWVNAAVDGADTFFPGVHFSDWTELSRTHHKKDADHAYDFDMVEYVRSSI
ncbi:dihydrofolate reductase [Dyella sp. SG562]|uniref:dihydrofolate reductase n=1 Tax=Dyella TaxID=231454 RepID=UPI00141DB7A8|nr:MULTISPECIES: dihydrofolate reductase [unclassified Dyella]MBT2118825.1 dihydrofolate reductase [Dyella sp. LX-1]MBT2141174.1 dihydrofolate reductase [Dyella sp. LX-66]NII71634.1 dihydrofolate reductase [Dyella sp. SG562]NKJ22854.1 dihydrofolate reductase [Dyella sp. SG609]